MEGTEGKTGIDPAWSDCKLLNHIAAGSVSAYWLGSWRISTDSKRLRQFLYRQIDHSFISLLHKSYFRYLNEIMIFSY